MECQASESKKLFQVFDATKKKRGKKKREGADGKSLARSASDETTSGQIQVVSAKASLQETVISKTDAFPSHDERNVDSSPSLQSHGSPRRHRRSSRRDNMSLALKAGFASTPRSNTPQREGDGTFESVPQDQGSFIYAFLEEAIKKDKKRQRHTKRHDDRDRGSRVRTSSRSEREPRDRRDHQDHRDHRDHRDNRDHRENRDHRDNRDNRDNREHRENRDHRHHRHRDDSPREPEKPPKVETPLAPVIDQSSLIETFAKLCATLNTKTENPPIPINNIQRSRSHKSLQCENVSRQVCNDVDHHPVKLTSHENSQGNIPVSTVRSHEDNAGKVRSRDHVPASRSLLPPARERRSSYCVPYEKENTIGEQQRQREQYTSKLDISGSKMHTKIPEDRRCEYASRPAPTRSVLNQSYRGYKDQTPSREPLRGCDYRRESDREYDRDMQLNRDYDQAIEPNRERLYDDERKRYYNQTSRSYDVNRELYDDRLHRTTRSDNHRDRRYDDRRYDDRDRKRYEEAEKRDKYYEDKIPSRDRNYQMFKERRDRRTKKNLERYERGSVTSRDDEYKDRFSERERDSGLSVADGESTVSARSNYLKLVKQEIMEQREAMDKMMNLWKELMRCFKSYSNTSGEKAVTESAANNARDTAAAQLRLWRECMRRYETVARDVGDTDARLIQTAEEINKQRSEMAEMSSMWQECLQRYRDMSNDFNNLKQKLATTPTASAPVLVPPVCAEGEGPAFAQPVYPPSMIAPGYTSGSPVRARASAPTPPPWWWGEPEHARTAARRSSPESRGSCDRNRERERERERERDRTRELERRRHKDRERDDSKYKEKSKPSAARYEHRRRKR